MPNPPRISLEANRLAISILSIDLFACERCGEDLHAHWKCPACGRRNLCAYLDAGTKAGRGTCEGCGLNVDVTGRVAGRYEWDDERN